MVLYCVGGLVEGWVGGWVVGGSNIGQLTVALHVCQQLMLLLQAVHDFCCSWTHLGRCRPTAPPVPHAADTAVLLAADATEPLENICTTIRDPWLCFCGPDESRVLLWSHCQVLHQLDPPGSASTCRPCISTQLEISGACFESPIWISRTGFAGWRLARSAPEQKATNL